MIYTIRRKILNTQKIDEETRQRTLIKNEFVTKNLDEAILKAKEILAINLASKNIKDKNFKSETIREDISITRNDGTLYQKTTLETFLLINEKLPF